MKVLLIFTTNNSESGLQKTLDDIFAEKLKIDILAVDLESIDNTKKILAKNNINFLSPIGPINHYEGMRHAIEYAHKNEYDITIQWNANYAFDAKVLKYILSIFQRSKPNMVFGTRFIYNKKIPFINQRFLSSIIKFKTKFKITDPTLRLRAFDNKSIEEILKYDNLSLDEFTVAHLLNKKFTAIETPVENVFKSEKDMLKEVGEKKRFISKMAFIILLSLNSK